MRGRRILDVALAVVLGLCAWDLLRAWPELPERVASRFDGAGQPVGWASREVLVASLAGFLLVTALSGWGIAALIAVLPASAINLPHREYWLAPERRPATLERLRVHTLRFALMTAAFLGLVTRRVLAYNLGQRDEGLGPELGWLVAGYLVGVLVWTLALLRGWRRPRQGSGAA